MKQLRLDPKKLQRLSPSKNAFASLVRSIIYQQLSGKAAEAILKKFLALFPRKSFPTPRDVLALSDAHFQSAGVSTQKRTYLRDLAEKFLDGTIEPKKFPHLSDEEIVEHLVAVKGVGVWTAHMFLIFALNRSNVLPVGDLAIRKGFQKVFKLRTEPIEKKMHDLARPYYGNYTLLALHLWDHMDAEKETKKRVVKKKKQGTISKK